MNTQRHKPQNDKQHLTELSEVLLFTFQVNKSVPSPFILSIETILDDEGRSC